MDIVYLIFVLFGHLEFLVLFVFFFIAKFGVNSRRNDMFGCMITSFADDGNV